jgi:putative sugar O-methyltransferase
MTSIARLEANFHQVLGLLKQDAQASASTVWGRTSEFWQDIFTDRSNFPSVEEFVAFRRGDFGYGMADERQGALDRERAHAERTCEIFRQSMDPARIAKLDESAFGAPYVFENFGSVRSAAFWTNAFTAARAADICGRFGNQAQPLNVLEIGAGWGCVSYILHQLLDVSSYTIIDLPENLLLSTNYVAATLGRPLHAVTMAGEGDAEPVAGGVSFGLPGCLGRLKGSYDLIVNSFSLQEMDLDTVHAYFAWIRQTLAPGGVFVSFNSHGKAGVRRPSDYPLQGFRPVSFRMFRQYPTGFLNTIPYELVLMRDDGGTAEMDADAFDVLGSLLQFGLGDDLAEMCADFIAGRLDMETRNSLKTLAGFFSLSDQSRRQALQSTDGFSKALPAVAAYLEAMHAFQTGDDRQAVSSFGRAIDLGLKGFARLRACVCLALLRGEKHLTHWNEDFDALLAYPELKRMLDGGDRGQLRAQFERCVSVELRG